MAANTTPNTSTSRGFRAKLSTLIHRQKDVEDANNVVGNTAERPVDASWQRKAPVTQIDDLSATLVQKPEPDSGRQATICGDEETALFHSALSEHNKVQDSLGLVVSSIRPLLYLLVFASIYFSIRPLVSVIEYKNQLMTTNANYIVILISNHSQSHKASRSLPRRAIPRPSRLYSTRSFRYLD